MLSVVILRRGPPPPKSTNHRQTSCLSAQTHSDFAIVIVGPKNALPIYFLKRSSSKKLSRVTVPWASAGFGWWRRAVAPTLLRGVSLFFPDRRVAPRQAWRDDRSHWQCA